MQKLNKNPTKQYKKHPKDTSQLHVNQAALGRFSQDGFWYRVRILGILTPQIVKVSCLHCTIFIGQIGSNSRSLGCLTHANFVADF